RRESALDGGAAAGFVDDVEVLVEPDRDRGTQLQKEAVRNPALRLRQSVRTRVVDATERAPAEREVAVQVDAVRVAAGSRDDAVRVEARYDPEIDAGRRTLCGEAVGDRDAGRLVAVDATDDDDLARARGIADLERDDSRLAAPRSIAERRRLDRPPAYGATEQNPMPAHRRGAAGE